MAGLDIKSARRPDERQPYGDNGEIGIFRMEDSTVARIELQPGWRWSKDVGPSAGIDACHHAHEGYCISGRVVIKMADGEQREIGAGDLFVIEPGHDAWVVGDEPWVAVDFRALNQPESASAGTPHTEQPSAP